VYRKSGDDYPARLYIIFKPKISKLGFFEKLKYRAIKLAYGKSPLHQAINYIWANKAPRGTMVTSAYTAKVIIFVVKSGRAEMKIWLKEERNIYKDYKRAFGNEPPMISGIAIMTDTDNTSEYVKAYYGDIFFKPEK
jgi:hypothetical protein